MRPGKLVSQLIELVYPRRCPICDGILEKKEIYVCGRCLPQIKSIDGAVCFTCGKPLEKEGEEYCFDCRKKAHVFLRCRAPFLYRGKMKDSLMRFKYLGRAEYAAFYGKAMVEYGKRQSMFENRDLLIPVPIHRERRIERGYNQAELLAKEISVLTGIPVKEKILLRSKKTKALKSVSGVSRSRNLSEAFSVPEKQKKELAGKRVLLIDDIYTTGSTADAVSACLIRAGAVSVDVLCLAVSPGFA